MRLALTFSSMFKDNLKDRLTPGAIVGPDMQDFFDARSAPPYAGPGIAGSLPSLGMKIGRSGPRTNQIINKAIRGIEPKAMKTGT